MTTNNVKGIKADIVKGLQKGQTGTGNIVSITQGTAIDYMTPEQIERRQVLADAPFAEIEIAIEGTLQTLNFKDYSRIGTGEVSEQSTMGKIMAICDIAEGSDIPMIAQETTGKPDNNGQVSKFVIWNVVGL